ncbi:MAG TPA: uroporphyrinogen decarboxylase family protein, partial [Dehalococcoidales bacterium]
MEKEWTAMTPEEKREKKIKQWLSTEGIKFNSQAAAKKYRERTARLSDAILLKKPDRVPVTLPVGNFPAYYAGKNLKTIMYDYAELQRVWIKFIHDFKDDMDSFNGPNLTYSGKALEIMNYKLYKWPGHGLSENVNSYQFVEGEYMKPEEYPAMIKDPGDFMLRTVLPRQFGSLGPLTKFIPLTSVYGRPLNSIMPFANPDIRAAFEAYIDAGKEWETWQKYVFGVMREALAEGFGFFRGTMATAPFDIIGDSLRGTQGVILDMYRRPEMLLEALNVITPLSIEHTIAQVKAMNGFMVTFPLHKGDDVFMSDKQFEKFYWPTLKQFILALREEGIMSFLFAEGKFMRRLEAIADLPKSWTVWQFDQTDMAKAKQVVGKTACIMG